jgi:hypothetical protein
LAQAFRRLGSEVDLVGRAERLLPGKDFSGRPFQTVASVCTPGPTVDGRIEAFLSVRWSDRPRSCGRMALA